jgi:valyl-tRNA synthetase
MPAAAEDAPLEARWIVAELHATAAKVNQSLEDYRYDDAANTIYQFFWGSFCDWYLEIVKLRLDFSMDGPAGESASEQARKHDGRHAALTTLVSVFEAALRLLSPFMPFITEEIWHALYDGNPPAKSIALTSYPQSDKAIAKSLKNYPQGTDVSVMSTIQRVVTALRAQRKACGVPEKDTVSARIYIGQYGAQITDAIWRDTDSANRELAEYLAKVNIEILHQPPLPGIEVRTEVGYDVEILYERTIDIPAERERLTKDIAKYEKGLLSAERQLGNQSFLAKAPAQVVEGLKKQEAETRLLLEKARAALENLKKED